MIRKKPKISPLTRKKRAKSPTNFAGDAVTIGELRAMMRQFVAEREWGKYHIPRNLAASVAVEAGELLELFQWHTTEEGDRRSQELTPDPQFRQAVGEEMT